MRITIPEQVWLDYEPASIATRGLAFLIDFIIRWLGFLLLVVLIGSLASSLEAIYEALRDIAAFQTKSNLSQIALAILLSLVLIVEISYPLYFEVMRQGVSPGKALFGLRVVDERGLPLTLRTSFLRTLFNVIDIQGVGLVALISMVLSKRSQRLGDLAAGTMVVHESKHRVDDIEWNKDQSPLLVSQACYQACQSYFEREELLLPEARQQIISVLLRRIHEERPELLWATPSTEKEARAKLSELYSRLHPQKKGQQVPDAGINWRALQEEFHSMKSSFQNWRRSKATVSRDDVYTLVEQYQKMCQRLAYLQTYYPETKQAKIASSLVREGRILIYGHRLARRDEVRKPFTFRLRTSFYLLRPYILVSTLTLVLGVALASCLVLLHPGFGYAFISEETATNLRNGYLWTDDIQGMSSIASSKIMTNNIKVTYLAFASGVSAGVLTVAVLFFNGALLGGIFTILKEYDGMAWRLFEFITAHGILELSIIAVAGGMGLFLGDAILRPGSLTRKAALAKHARISVDLLIFNSLCLVIAGIVEGYISPYNHIPYGIKLGVGVSLGLAYWGFLTRQHRLKPE